MKHPYLDLMRIFTRKACKQEIASTSSEASAEGYMFTFDAVDFMASIALGMAPAHSHLNQAYNL
ncbi:MAG: hypothetical protein R2741_06625 [Methanolobus sp.]